MWGISQEELHATMSHGPIVLLVLAVLFDLLSYARRIADLQIVAFILLGLGWLGSVGAVATGWLVQENGQAIPQTETLLWIHRANGFLIVGVFGGLLLVRVWQRGRLPGSARAYVIAGLVGMLLVVLQGYMGGTMVYDYGVGTLDPK